MIANIAIFAVYVLISAGALLIYKHFGIETGGEDGQILLRFHMMSLVAILGYAVSFLLWLVIVTRMKLSVAMPLNFGLVNLAVLIGAAIFLREKITLLQWAGVAVIMAGIFMITQGGESN